MSEEPQNTPSPENESKPGLTPKKPGLSLGNKPTLGKPESSPKPQPEQPSPAKATSGAETSAPSPASKPVASTPRPVPAKKTTLRKPVTLAKPRPTPKTAASKSAAVPSSSDEEKASVSVPMVIVDVLAFAACVAFAIILFTEKTSLEELSDNNRDTLTWTHTHVD